MSLVWLLLLRATRHTPIQRRIYHAYLKSETWQRRSDTVLRAADRWCVGCGRRPATQAHHTTYARVGWERLGDLVAVCARCHRDFHGRNR